MYQLHMYDVPPREYPGYERVGEFTPNQNPSKSLLTFIPEVNVNVNRRGSHTYIIDVDGVIKKIGASTMKLRDYAGYGVGNGGRPSIRTTGIHYMIAEELDRGKKVTFHVKMCPTATAKYTDLSGNVRNEEFTIDPKQVETREIAVYVEINGSVPAWNMQEQGRHGYWCPELVRINQAICASELIPFEESHRGSIYMRLYHSKYTPAS